jgi:ribose 5-phosphate isomerase B
VSDHAGVACKAALARALRAAGHEVSDLGTHDEASVDYPDFAARGAREVAAGRAERGVFLCGTGIGVCIAANKVRGVRAANPCDEHGAEMARRHNDANVLCLGARVLEESRAWRLVERFLATPFDGGRHAGRVEKIARIEREESGPTNERTG